MLSVSKLIAGYGSTQILWDVSFKVNDGEVVSILGSNGAGKTTIVRTLSGLIKARGGSIQFNGTELSNLPSTKILECGLVQVPEGRQLFVDMTVYENLELGAFNRECKAQMPETLKILYEWFPKLEERKHQLVGTLSGGEQQMVAVARGILSQPKLLIFDEPSLGLAPNIVDQILQVARTLADQQGISVILVEQDIRKALKVSTRGYVVENGSITLTGNAAELLENPDIKKAYLGF